MSRINTTVDSGDAVTNSDLVIEAIIENMDIKHKLFSELDQKAPRYALNILYNYYTVATILKNSKPVETI